MERIWFTSTDFSTGWSLVPGGHLLMSSRSVISLQGHHNNFFASLKSFFMSHFSNDGEKIWSALWCVLHEYLIIVMEFLHGMLVTNLEES